MPVHPGLVRRVALSAAAWLLALAAGGYALRHPSSLVLDFGAGDEAVASGFDPGWEQYEVRGKTTFRWTGAEAWAALPLSAHGPTVEVEMRLARFADHATEMTLATPGKLQNTWLQHPVGWRLRRLPPRAWDGPVALRWSAPALEGVPTGIALDWCALYGVESVWPRSSVWLGLLALLVGTPLLLAMTLGHEWRVCLGAALLLTLLAAWATRDTVAAFTTIALAGPRVLMASALIALLARWQRRHSATLKAPSGRHAFWAPALLVVVALLALSNPRYHYPDVDTHARFLDGLRAHPGWALDPREYQQQTRAWTRLIGGQYIGFPYSATFHVLAWPLAPLIGDVGAVKTMAALAVALSLLLVYRVARTAGASRPTAVLAQLLFALMPVIPSRLTLALLPSLLGQTLELLLVLALATRLGDLARWRERGLTLLLLFVVQLGYTGSLFNVAALVLLWASVELVQKRWRNATWVLTAYALAALAVAVLQYAYFVPTLVQQVAPHLGSAAAAPDVAKYGTTPLDILARAGARLWIFFGPFGLALALAGWTQIARQTGAIRRALFVALGAGLLLAFLRPALPVLFADAKEVELLAAPMAVAAALGGAWMWTRGRAWRALSLLLLTALLSWSVAAAWALYANRLMSCAGA